MYLLMIQNLYLWKYFMKEHHWNWDSVVYRNHFWYVEKLYVHLY